MYNKVPFPVPKRVADQIDSAVGGRFEFEVDLF